MTLQLGHRKTKGRIESFWADWSGCVNITTEPSIDVAAAMLGDLASGRHFEVSIWTCAEPSRILSEMPRSRVERVGSVLLQ